MSEARSLSADAARLVGAWRLQSMSNPEGAEPSGGRAPDGMLLYAADGYMSAQIVTPREGGEALNSYFGTYSVNGDEGVIVHHRAYNNTAGLPEEVVRAYRFVSDDVMVISPRGSAAELTFRRAVK